MSILYYKQAALAYSPYKTKILSVISHHSLLVNSGQFRLNAILSKIPVDQKN